MNENVISVNQTIAPVSTLSVPGLFAVSTEAVTLSELLKGKIPARAQTVLLRARGTNQGTVYVERLDNPGARHALLPEAGIEMSVADLATHWVRADGDQGDSIVAAYTRLMNEKE
jgi:hypothetical protein